MRRLKKFINRLFKTTAAPKPFLPVDTRVYCIGDIHGRYDLLATLIEKIKQDAGDFSGHVVMVYLGDFIDRGLFSMDVIDFILGDVQAGIDYIYLRGNHEQTLLDFLQEDSVGRSWLNFGGQATLASYGVAVAKIPTKREDFLEIQRQLRNNLPDTHYRFLLGTRLSYTLGSYFFVHAGVNPHYSLAKQSPEDMLWIRDEFTAFKKPFEKIIVHGHTVTDGPELRPNRIGIDTGAYASGVLTCLVLQSDQQRLIQTHC
jgi:serine/threonine protein phosphatase 1